MYKTVIISIILIVLMASSVFSQEDVELPEPTVPPIAYVAQISWGPGAVNWQSIPIKSFNIIEAPLNIHTYWHIGVGDYYFDIPIIGDPLKKLNLVIEITEMPNQALWGYFRIKIGEEINGVVSEQSWTEASYWVGVLNLTTRFGRPRGY